MPPAKYGQSISVMNRRSIIIGAGATIAMMASTSRARLPDAAIVDPEAKLTIVHTGGRWLEGPVWDRRRGRLVVSDVKANKVLSITPGSAATPLRDPSNNTNGNAFDRDGRLICCEHLTRRVVRQEKDGRITVLADRHAGKRLNSPNDLAVAADGSIWFTDPVFGITVPDEGLPAKPEQRGRFVYRIDPTGALSVVADGFDQPNGIVFAPDGRTLYVSDTGGALNAEGPREIRAFDVVDSRRLTRERRFARLDHGIPDGLTVDTAGRVYAATADGAAIWSPAGEPLGIIPTPLTCGNLEFGGRDGRTLFLCATDRVLSIDTNARGWA